MNWAQFESWMSKKLSACNPEQDMVNSFKNFDTNGDGTISTEELAQVRNGVIRLTYSRIC